MSRAQSLVDALLEKKWMAAAEKDVEDRGTEGVCSGKNFGGPSCRPGTRRYTLAKTFKKVAHESVNEDCGHCAKLFTGPPGDVYDAALELTELFGEEEIGVDSHHRDLLLIAEYENLPSTHKAEIERITAKYGLNPTVESASNILAAVNEVKHGAGQSLHDLIDSEQTVELQDQLYAQFPAEASEQIEVIISATRRADQLYNNLHSLPPGSGGSARRRTNQLYTEIASAESDAHEALDHLLSQYGVTP